MRAKSFIINLLLPCFILCSFPGTQASLRAQDKIQVYFSPGGGAQGAIIETFEEARSNIIVAMYLFSNVDLADALIAAQKGGIRVRVVVDGSQDQRAYSRGRYMYENGVSIRVDRSHMITAAESQGIMHNKFAVVDDSTIITGSYNWTQAAEIQNEENLLIIREAPDIARRYMAEFEKLWKQSVSYDVKQLSTPLILQASDKLALRENTGQKAYVQGVVHDVHFSTRSGTFFINFGPDRADFTGVIFESASKKFSKNGIDPKTYEKKNIEVYGKIIDHPRYGLEIIIENPVQVNILSKE